MAEKKTDKAKTMLAQIAENPMGRKVVLVIGLVGIGLICLSSFFSLDSTAAKQLGGVAGENRGRRGSHGSGDAGKRRRASLCDGRENQHADSAEQRQ